MRGAIIGRVATLALAGATLLSACAAPAPSVAPTPAPVPAAAAPGPESVELAAYYRRIQSSLLTQGLLRTDGGGPDVPYNARNLAQNFVTLALYEEYAETAGRLVARQNSSRLHRWVQPVTLSVRFGDTIPPEQRRTDAAQVAQYANRIARVTGHPITRVPEVGNFQVMFLNEAERRALGPELARLIPGISRAALNTVVNMPRSTYCLALASDPEADGTYARAVVIVRGEHPDLLRSSCIHEEIAQAMGLSNDSPRARPSIFNDDEEFGFLTTHDEMLLKMLYDSRLRPGMTEAEARPIAELIATELMGGSV